MWTYLNQPTTRQIDAVRLMIGDVDGDDPQLTDEEIQYYLDNEGNVTSAAIECVRVLMAIYARKVDKSVGDLRISYSQRSTQYAGLLDRLSSRQGIKDVQVYAGGIDVATKESNEDDTSIVQPAFTIDEFDPPTSDDLIS